MFLCLFNWSLSSHSKIFHSYGDVTITGEGLQILTYARHSWPLSSEGSLACHIYCDMGHPFIMVISEDPWHSHLLLTVCQSWLGFEHLPICQLRLCLSYNYRLWLRESDDFSNDYFGWSIDCLYPFEKVSLNCQVPVKGFKINLNLILR